VSSEVSQVYANALFSLAKEQGDQTLQQTRADLRQCALLFSLSPDLTRLLSLPTVSVSERQGIARKIFGDEGLAARLLQLLVDHGRVRFLGEIADDFDRQMLDYQDTVEVTVTTAVPLTPDQLERLTGALQRRLQKTVRITEHIDRAVLGGVIVQYGDTRIDNSVKFRLDSLRERLTT
jgi:F-type H+-transporting ATPase subunit delta